MVAATALVAGWMVVMLLLSPLAAASYVSNTPSAPTNLKAIPGGTGDIRLSWVNPAGEVTNNHVYEFIPGTPECTHMLAWFNLTTAKMTYDVAGLWPNGTFCFAVTATVGGVESPLSAFVTSKTDLFPPIAHIPSDSATIYWTVATGFFIVLSVLLALVILHERFRPPRHGWAP